MDFLGEILRNLGVFVVVRICSKNNQKAVQILAILPWPRVRDPCIYTIGNNSRIDFCCQPRAGAGLREFDGVEGLEEN